MYRTDLSIIPAEFRTPQIVENCFKRNYTEMSKYPDLVTADIAVAVVKYCGAMAMPYIPEHFFREKYAPMIGAALMYQRGENVLPDYIPKEWWPASYVKYLIQRRVIKSLSEVPSRLLDRADIRALLPSD
jgi:hypothetical protein